MLERIESPIIAFSELLPMPGCSTVETLQPQLVSEEYELDLGLQEKEKNREIYGY